MAHLIINFECPESGGACESWYDFNPEDHETIARIEALLAYSGSIDRKTRERELAELCKASLMKEPVDRNTGRIAKMLNELHILLMEIINEKLFRIWNRTTQAMQGIN